jgi:hypothetical protein
VIVGVRPGDTAETAVTATFKNDVSLETAVPLLADMANLKAVVMDNALYVTTKANAKMLETEQEKKQPRANKSHPEKPARARAGNGSPKKPAKSQ